MDTLEYGYLILVLLAFCGFALAGGIGIMKYRAWRERRGGTAATGLARGPDCETPPSYPRPERARS